jgi:iron complex outermembrane receptor protein
LNVTTTADTQGNLIPSGTYPVGHPVAVTLGSTPLSPEESTSFTVGAIFQPFDNTSVTLDYYDIEIEDRLALLGPNTITAADVPALTAAGVENADLLVGSLASFFANAFDSEVSGIDLAVTSDFDLGPGFLTVDLRHNFNEQEVSNVIANTINASRVFDLENQVPEQRTMLTLDYRTGELFGGYVRFNRYGSWQSTGGLFSPGDGSDVSSYGSEILVDLEVNFTFAGNYTLAAGGENVFDTDPDPEQDPVLRILGVDKAITSPFGFNGGFWYVRAAVDF